MSCRSPKLWKVRLALSRLWHRWFGYRAGDWIGCEIHHRHTDDCPGGPL